MNKRPLSKEIKDKIKELYKLGVTQKDFESSYEEIKNSLVQCTWELYGQKCNEESVMSVMYNKKTYHLCESHSKERCTKCHKQAVHGCPMELQFVCGEPLCPDCHHNSDV